MKRLELICVSADCANGPAWQNRSRGPLSCGTNPQPFSLDPLYVSFGGTGISPVLVQTELVIPECPFMILLPPD